MKLIFLLLLSIAPQLPREICDTLETSDPRIQLVLYKDHTWEYRKDMEKFSEDTLFTQYWDNTTVNPYKVKIEEMPYRVILWLADSVSNFTCPFERAVFSKFGWRHGRQHMGVDLPGPKGTPIYAAFDGKVRMAKKFGGYGNVVVLRHDNGLETTYGHLSSIKVAEGDWVHSGDVVGEMGSTGHSTGPHLHFETRFRGAAFDPQWIIDFENGRLRDSVFVLKVKHLIPGCQYVQSSDEEENAIYQSEEEARAEAERLIAEMNARKYYKIRSGDTLGAIARRYGTTVTAICRLNDNLTAKTTLKIGRTIRVR